MRRSRLRTSLLTLLGYVLLSLLLFGRKALGGIDHTVVGFGPSPEFYGRDQGAFVWFLAWGAHAVFHLQNPFLTREVYAPGGYNLAWAASLLGPAIVLSPLTRLWGAVVTYNLLALLAPAGAAWGAFLLCRDLVTRTSSAVVGGLIFGFGSYEAGVTINHLNLALVGLLPIAALLVVRRLRERISRRRFIALLGLVLGAQLWISTETFSTAVVFGGLALLTGFLVGDRMQRRLALRTAYEAAAAVVIGVLIGFPYAWYALTSSSPLESHVGTDSGADALNFIEPTHATWLHPLTTRFAANVPEDLSYLGPVLLLVLVIFLVELRKRRLARFLWLFMVLAAVLSLGGVLRVAGETTTFKLPWTYIAELPYLSHPLPGRFALYISLAAAVCVALWLDRPALRVGRWVLVVAVMVSLVPNLDGGLWGTRLDRPALLSSPELTHYVAAGSTVLALPFGISGNSMPWQVQADFRFRLAGGYVGWALPKEYEDLSIVRELHGRPPEAELKRRLCGFLSQTHTSTILLRLHTKGDWRAILRPLHEHPIRRGGFAIYSVARSRCARGPGPL